jgi:hypothetical protein
MTVRSIRYSKPDGGARNRQTTSEWIIKAYAAAALEALIRDGMSLELASRKVARALPGLERIGRKRNTSTPIKMVLDWREEFRQGKRPSGVPTVVFDTIVRMLGSGTSPTDAADEAIKRARLAMQRIR